MTATANTPVGITEAPGRIPAIDMLRGLAIVLMMLDHSRDFIHREAMFFDPTNLAQTTPWVFLTRWVTHFCAPTFVFLAGVSARIQSIRGMPKPELTRWLIGRGVFLIALELTVIRPLIWFDVDFRFLAHLQVIWAIGWSMIVLAGLIWLPDWLIGALGLAIVAGHNLLDGIQTQLPARTWPAALWVILHQGGTIVVTLQSPATVLAHYPLIPWVGVMALGYAIGSIYRLAPDARRKWLAIAGLSMVGVFLAMRTLVGYGDPNPWSIPSPQEARHLNDWQRVVFSLINTEKYPPSFQYLCMTLGPSLLFLALANQHKPRWLGRRLTVYGSVPLFFYILQWPTVHLIAQAFQWLAAQPYGQAVFNLFGSGESYQGGPGFGLAVVYVGWAIGLLVLYPICALYGRFKRRHRNWRWLSLF